MSASDPLPTIWRVPDDLWAILSKLLAVYDPPSKTGRPRVDQRKALDGIVFRLRSGCQWNQLPQEFGNDTSVYRTFRRWETRAVFDLLWAVLLTLCEELGGVDWQWQAADGCLGKARGVPRHAGDPDHPRTAKKGRRTNASAPTRPTAPRQASRRACLSRETVARLVSASPEPMSPT